MSAKTAPYKVEQQKSKAALKPRVIWSTRATLNLGIKKFKRDNKGDAWAINQYKTNVWSPENLKNVINKELK